MFISFDHIKGLFYVLQNIGDFSSRDPKTQLSGLFWKKKGQTSIIVVVNVSHVCLVQNHGTNFNHT